MTLVFFFVGFLVPFFALVCFLVPTFRFDNFVGGPFLLLVGVLLLVVFLLLVDAPDAARERFFFGRVGARVAFAPDFAVFFAVAVLDFTVFLAVAAPDFTVFLADAAPDFPVFLVVFVADFVVVFVLRFSAVFFTTFR